MNLINNLINLTPEPIVILTLVEGGAVTGYIGNPTKPIEGHFRVNGTLAPTGKDLPEPKDGVKLVVSIATAQAAVAAGRTTGDLLITADPVRDSAGKVIGYQKFSIFSATPGFTYVT